MRFVAIEKGAISHLARLTEDYKNVLLVADENTYAAAGEKTVAALGNKLAKKVIFSGETILIPNENAVDTVNAQLKGMDLIVGIGFGVIQDLCKYVAHTHNLPCFVVATAPSMDGYASTSIVRGEEYFPHGIDVAYSTVVTAALREEILKKPWPAHAFRPARQNYVKEVTRIYGPVAEGCIALQDKVGLYTRDTIPVYQEREAQIREILAQMPKASEIEAMLGQWE